MARKLRKTKDISRSDFSGLAALIAETCPVGIIILDVDGEIIYVNNRAEEIAGLKRDKFVGHHFSTADWKTSTLDGNAESEEDLAIRRAAESGSPVYDVRHRIERPDGRRVYISVNATLLKDEHGKFTGIMATFNDITAQIETEKELEESNRLLKETQSLARLGSWKADLVAEKTFFTDEIYDIYGISRNVELRSDTMLALVHPDDRQKMQAWINALIGGESPADFELRILHGDGSIHWIHGGGHLEVDRNGRPRYAFGIVQDITERKQAQESLAASELRYRTLFESSTDAIMLVDAETSRIIDCNPKAAVLEGRSIEELKKLTVKDLRSAEKNLLLTRQFGKAPRGERKTDTLEIPAIDNGSALLAALDVRSTGVKIKGQKAIMNIVRDVSEQYRYEQSLQRLNRALSIRSQCDEMLVRTGSDWKILSEACRILVETGGYKMAWAGLVKEGGKKVLSPTAHSGYEEGFLSKTELCLAESEKECGPACLTFRSGAPVVTPDISAYTGSDAWRSEAEKRGYRSSIILPLNSGNETMGIINIFSDAAEAFDDEEIGLLAGVADDLAYGIAAYRERRERRRAQALAIRRSRELNTVNKVISETSSMLDLQAVLDRSLEGVLELTGMDGGSLCTVDEARGTLVLSAHKNLTAETIRDLTENEIKVGDCLCGHVAENNEPLILWDNASGSEFATREANRNEGIRFHAAFPLNAQDKTIAVLCIFSRGSKQPEQSTLDLVQGLGSHLALAIENARLYEEIKKHAGELKERVAERTQELEATNADLKAFSYSVSHDLRAPLRSIDGFSRILLEEHSGKLDGQGRDYLKRVLESSSRMNLLIDDILELFQVTHTQMTRQQVDLSAMAASIAEGLQKDEPDREVEFVIATGLAAGGDSRLLRVLMENLLDNSWKFTSGHRTARIEFGRTTAADGAAYFVRDDGAGFDMAYADKLFMPFQRLHTPAEFPGTGIGLATVKRIVRRHGGRVWAEAATEKGATIYFTLAKGEEE